MGNQIFGNSLVGRAAIRICSLFAVFCIVMIFFAASLREKGQSEDSPQRMPTEDKIEAVSPASGNPVLEAPKAEENKDKKKETPQGRTLVARMYANDFGYRFARVQLGFGIMSLRDGVFYGFTYRNCPPRRKVPNL